MNATTIRNASNLSIDALGTLAANTAMRAAADYLRLHKIAVTDYQRASDLIKAQCKIALNSALNDAMMAVGCGMTDAAVATFKASMIQAGIAAAKEYAAAV